MITILMAACNSEKYIAEQIESIFSQTETDWKLVIQDDCSKDRTAEIAYEYVRKCPDKMVFVELKTPSGSAKSNFFSMLKYADTEYMMTCDHDDVWLPNKIEAALKKMNELEGKFGHDIPLLVHSDLKVVDEGLNIISSSMFALQKLKSRKDKLNNLLVQNIVTGCTMMVNGALLDTMPEVPEQAIMHDWWLALVAAAFGHIGFVSKPTVLYRQHGNNEVGAKKAGSLRYNLKRMLRKDEAKSVLQDTYAQAKSFMQIYKKQLNAPHLEIVKEYGALPEYSKTKRLRTIIKYDFWKYGFFRKCGQIFFA